MALWSKAIEPLTGKPEAMVHRDFHIDNLMVLKDRTGVARCGLLDFQDAVRGPREYDLMSLLQDARRDLGRGVEDAMLDYYAQNAPGQRSRAEIARRFALLGVQRHSRIAGIFVRLCRRDGKRRYLKFLPRVLRQIESALQNAGLTEIETLLDTELRGWRTGDAILELSAVESSTPR